MPSKPDSITTAIKILRAFFKVHTPLISRDNGVTWFLNSEYSKLETEDDKENHYTLYFFPIRDELSKIADRTPFYFSFGMTIKANDEIEKLNLKIFKDDSTKVKTTASIPTELILRVEWDNTVGDDLKACKHAQPHWHIHSYKHVDLFEKRENGEIQTILELLGLDKTTHMDVSPIMQAMEDQSTPEHVKAQPATFFNEAIPLFRFHLAMIAEWDKNADSLCNKILDNEKLKVWLPQCLNYIKEQLEYILEKIGNHEPSDIQSADSIL